MIHDDIFKIQAKIKILPFFFFILYKLILDLSYYLIIPSLNYYAIYEMNLDIVKLIESYILATIVFALMPKLLKKISNMMIWLLILLSYVPMLTIFAFQDQSRIFMYAVGAFWLLVFFLYSYMPTLRLQKIKRSQAKIIYLTSFVSLLALSLYTIYRYLDFSIIFDLSKKIYDARFQFIGTKIFLHGYFFHWIAAVFNPILFAISIVRKKWIYAGLIIFLQLLIASTVGLRSYFFYIPLALGLIWLVTRKHKLMLLEICLILIVLTGVMSYYLIDDFIYSFSTARFLLVPAQLSFFYYDFFSTHQLIPLAYTFKFYLNIPYFLDYPYNLAPAHLIGANYYNQPGMAAVGGMIPDSYMNFGFLGFILLAGILVIILKLFDSCSKRIDIRIAAAAIVVPVLSLSSTYLIRTLITSGLLLSLLLLYLLPKKK